jgi:hypothetical protein
MRMLKCGMMMTLVAAAVALPSFGQNEPQRQRTNRVAGMWRPLSLKSTLNGVTSQPFGPHPDGLLEFNENLHYVECIVNPDVPAFAASDPQNATATEIRTAFLGSLSLFGTYTINSKGEFTGNYVDGATIPNWKGNTRDNAHLTEVVNGDTMSEVFHNGDLTVEITWQRVK